MFEENRNVVHLSLCLVWLTAFVFDGALGQTLGEGSAFLIGHDHYMIGMGKTNGLLVMDVDYPIEKMVYNKRNKTAIIATTVNGLSTILEVPLFNDDSMRIILDDNVGQVEAMAIASTPHDDILYWIDSQGQRIEQISLNNRSRSTWIDYAGMQLPPIGLCDVPASGMTYFQMDTIRESAVARQRRVQYFVTQGNRNVHIFYDLVQTRTIEITPFAKDAPSIVYRSIPDVMAISVNDGRFFTLEKSVGVRVVERNANNINTAKQVVAYFDFKFLYDDHETFLVAGIEPIDTAYAECPNDYCAYFCYRLADKSACAMDVPTDII